MRRLIDNGNRPITPKPHIGHYGRLRKAYLEQYRHRLYTALVASEKLYPHLEETDRAARDMLDYLMPRLAREAGATEALKAADPMKWVGLMNNCKARAEEIVMHELNLCLTVKSRKNRKSCDNSRPDDTFPVRRFLSSNAVFSKSRAGENTEKCPYCVTGAQKGACMRTGITKQEKTTDIWFDEKDPLIHIRTHNTALKKRLLAYSRRYPAICQQTDADPETGRMEFDIEKGRFSFRLTAPYSEERRRAARQYARENNAADRLK